MTTIKTSLYSTVQPKQMHTSAQSGCEYKKSSPSRYIFGYSGQPSASAHGWPRLPIYLSIALSLLLSSPVPPIPLSPSLHLLPLSLSFPSLSLSLSPSLSLSLFLSLMSSSANFLSLVFVGQMLKADAVSSAAVTHCVM